MSVASFVSSSAAVLLTAFTTLSSGLTSCTPKLRDASNNRCTVNVARDLQHTQPGVEWCVLQRHRGTFSTIPGVTLQYDNPATHATLQATAYLHNSFGGVHAYDIAGWDYARYDAATNTTDVRHFSGQTMESYTVDGHAAPDHSAAADYVVKNHAVIHGSLDRAEIAGTLGEFIHNHRHLHDPYNDTVDRPIVPNPIRFIKSL